MATIHDTPSLRSRTTTIAAAALALVACAGTPQTVKPDEMSAAEHRAEAQKENEAAHRESAAYAPGAARPAPFGDPLGKDYLYAAPVYNPTESHLAEADRHRAHARQHQAAAQYLEKFEQAECGDFPPSSRAACPLLGPVTQIADIEGGVRVRFVAGTRVDAVAAHMRCHYAYARARGFDVAAACPLYLRGIEIRRGLDPATIEIVSRDKKTAAAVRERSREEAVFVGGAAHRHGSAR